MTPKHSTQSISVELTEQLVAYLDGELDEKTRVEIAKRIEDDPACRTRANELKQTWDLLEDLPPCSPSEGFARTTLELAAVNMEQDVNTAKKSQRSRRWYSLGIGSACTLAGLALGYFLTMRLLPDPDAELIRDLPVIENLDPYLIADDIEFLRDLQRNGLFTLEDTDEN